MIQSKEQLRTSIRQAETAAAILESPGHRFDSRGERESIARLLKDLADIARRAFDPHARHDFAVIPREVRDEDDAPGLFERKGGA